MANRKGHHLAGKLHEIAQYRDDLRHTLVIDLHAVAKSGDHSVVCHPDGFALNISSQSCSLAPSSLDRLLDHLYRAWSRPAGG